MDLLLALIEFTPIVSIDVGPLSISPHGIATAVGFVAARLLLLPATRALGVDDDLTLQMLYRAAIGALVGAPVAYAMNHWSDYADDPLSVLAVWEGGISLFGGITGGVLAAMTVMRRERLSVWRLLDAAAPGLALGIAIGRIGDLIVADHLGRPTDSVLGFRCTGAPVRTRRHAARHGSAPVCTSRRCTTWRAPQRCSGCCSCSGVASAGTGS